MSFSVCLFVFFKFILVTNNKGHTSIETVHVIRPTTDKIDNYVEILHEISQENASTNEIRMFEFEHVRYIFNHRFEQFTRMQHLDEISTTNQLIYPNESGISINQRDALYVTIYLLFSFCFESISHKVTLS